MSLKKSLFFAMKSVVIVLLFLLIFRPEWLGFDKGLFGGVRVVDVWREMRAVSGSGPGWFAFWIGCAVLVKLAGIGCGILRWKLLLRGQGLSMPLGMMAYQWFMGRAIGLVLPGTMGLDGFRLIESSRHTRDPIKCATVIAVEKLTGIIALAFLLFVTFPLGFKYLHINRAMLAAVMLLLSGGVAGSLLLLLNPRVIQVAVSVFPVPGKLRRVVNRLGGAVTAYSGSRASLLLALLCGLGVHLGTCMVFQCTFMAIRAENASVADILFVSPLMITASVLAFTISGMGVREVAFGLVLGATAGHATAILGGHLELWAGELIPFVLSIPLLVFGGASREKLRRDAEELRSVTPAPVSEEGWLTPEQTSAYRRRIAAALAAGLFGGMFAGMFGALAESCWLAYALPMLEDGMLFTWGAAAYGAVFAGAGAAAACGLVFVFLLLDRFPRWTVTFSLSFAGLLAAQALVIGAFRYQRDVLAGHGMQPRDLAMLGLAAAGLALVGFTACLAKAWAADRLTRGRVFPLLALGAAGALLMVAVAAGAGRVLVPEKDAPSFAPKTRASGPNIILCAIDALRADYLKLYDPAAAAAIPALEKFAGEAVLFRQSFAHASWTKPSFATMFTGTYPETHGAVSKNSMISKNVPFLAEELSNAGYYTKGFSNNPNTLSVFGFDRGFADYVDLKPSALYGASAAATRLAVYQVLRKATMVAEGKLRGGRMRITDFYQPAESVTRAALDWLDGGARPKDAPFYLYLHYMDPHDPFMDHSRPGVGYARARMSNPEPERFLEPMRKAYESEIEYMDGHLDALFAGLRERGLYDNTLIVFVSDHGEEFFDHGGWWHGYTLYEEMVRIPLIMKLPGGAHAGEVNDGMARHIDLAPTMLRFAGAAQPAAMPGQALFDASGAFANGTITHAFGHNDFEGNVLHSVRTLNRALIVAEPGNPRGLAPRELYDMTADPYQQKNAAAEPGQAEALRALEELLRIHGAAPGTPGLAPPDGGPAVDGVSREQLEALGYL